MKTKKKELAHMISTSVETTISTSPEHSKKIKKVTEKAAKKLAKRLVTLLGKAEKDAKPVRKAATKVKKPKASKTLQLA